MNPTIRRTRLLGSLLGSLLAALLVLGTAGTTPAYAHAGLVSSDPEDGAALTEVPTEVTLEFSEEVREPAFIVVTGPEGTTLGADDPVLEGPEVSQTLDVEALAAGRVAGAWTIAYRVVSADGHPIQGHVRFRVKEGAEVPATATAAPASEDPAPRTPSPGADATNGIGAAGDDETDDLVAWGLIGGVAVLLATAVALQARRRRTAGDES